MLNVGGGELVLLIVLALVILGPDKLPGYAAKLAQFVRSARDMAEGAKTQIKDEMGPGFEDVDWRALDPRQYDPRRIVREALATTTSGDTGAGASGGDGATSGTARGETAAGRAANEAAISSGQKRSRAPRSPAYNATLPTPWDADAT